MYDLYDVKERLSCMAWCSISEFCWEVNEGQVNTRWMTMQAAPDGILENVNCDCKSGCSTRRCDCQKNRIEVYWSLFLLRLHKFSRPEYRPRRTTWWRWHWIQWNIWRTMMVMHLGIIFAVQQISIYLLVGYSSFSFGPQYLYYKHVYPSHGHVQG